MLSVMAVNYRRVPLGRAAGSSDRNRRFIAHVRSRTPSCARKLTPEYGIGCKRPSVSNPYLRTFNRDNVELVTEPIERVTADGRPHRGRHASARSTRSILATGFRLASDPENYRRTPVRGRDGFDLATHYEANRLKAYESDQHARAAQPLHDLRPLRLDRRAPGTCWCRRPRATSCG